MLDDEFLNSLPMDAEEAFMLLEQELRRIASEDNYPNGDSSEDAWRRYVIELNAFVEENGVRLSFPFEVDEFLPLDTDTFWSRLSGLKQNVAVFVARGRHRRAATRRKSASAYVVLEASERRKIQQYLTKIRELVDASEIGDAKKEAIRQRLSELQDEIDRDKTRAEAAFGAYLAVKREMGKAGDDLVRLLDKVVTVLAKAKPLIEAIKGPKEQKKLPPPKREADPTQLGSFDDEIPF